MKVRKSRYNFYPGKSAKTRVDKYQNKQIAKLKRQLKPEKKVIDINDDYTPSNSWYVQPLTLIAEGDEYNTREGRKIRATSVVARGQVKINPGATATTVRICLVRDKASNGAVPQPSDIFQTTDDLQSPMDIDTRGTRFIMLADRTYDLSINGNRVKSFKFGKKLSHLITYNGSSNTSAQLTTGHLFLVFMSNETSDADKRAELNIWVRTSFTDI